MSDPKKPVPGDLSIDATDVVVTDITPEQINKLTKIREGFEPAVTTVLNVKQADLERAGINEKDVTRLADAFATEKRIAELLPAAEKLVELLYETKQLRRHDIATLLAEMAAQVRRRAERSANGAEVLGPFSAMLEYQYAPAVKGAATREKAKEAKQDGAPPANGSPANGATP